jgi:hypothetical protein
MVAGTATFTPAIVVAFLAPAAEPPTAAMVHLRGVDPRDRGDPGDLAVRLHLRHQVFLN